MADLRSMIEALGDSNVTSLLNNRNAVFVGSVEPTNTKIVVRIGGTVTGQFGMNIPVTVRSDEDDWHPDGDSLYLSYLKKLTGATFPQTVDVRHTDR